MLVIHCAEKRDKELKKIKNYQRNIKDDEHAEQGLRKIIQQENNF